MRKKWYISTDQRMQESREYRDDLMVYIDHDNKCGTHNEISMTKKDFLEKYKDEKSNLYLEIFAFLSSTSN
jgi:hypothetical protein